MNRTRLGWLLLSPTLAILFLFGVFPFLYVLWVSFHEWNPFAANPYKVFNWAANYRKLVFDDGFLASFGATCAFVFFAVTSQVILGYALAQAFLRDFPGKAFFRTIHTLPLIMAPIIVGSVWKLMTTPSIGVIPYVLKHTVGFDLNIGTSALAAFTVTVVMDIWHWTPLVTLTMIAALVSLPAEPFEQAQIDGAGKRQIFWHITLPMIRPALIATVFIRLMDAMRTVDEVLMLTGGGPGSATRYVGVHIFKEVFPRTNYGYGSAISVIVLYITIVVCWLLYVSLIAPRVQRGQQL
ncbi:MAG: carbohydrate ABC transporter permease [Paracoccaceae bacterium]